MNLRDFVQYSMDFPQAYPISEKFIRNVFVKNGVGDLLVQAKIDGHRRVIGRDEDGHFAFGKRVSLVSGKREDFWPKLEGLPSLKGLDLPKGILLDCEIAIPGKDASAVSTGIKARSAEIVVYCFSVLFSDYKKRESFGFEVEHAVNYWPIIPIPAIAYSHSSIWSSYFDDVHKQAKRESQAGGWEGYVVKGGPWSKIGKYKEMPTYDVLVTGVKPGQAGKYWGMVGALICSAPDYENGQWVEVAACSGMDDETRKQFTATPPINKVIEVSAQGVGSKGRLRHPQFKRIRDDKGPADVKSLHQQT